MYKADWHACEHTQSRALGLQRAQQRAQNPAPEDVQVVLHQPAAMAAEVTQDQVRGKEACACRSDGKLVPPSPYFRDFSIDAAFLLCSSRMSRIWRTKLQQ